MYRVNILAYAITIRLQFYPNLGSHIQKFIGLFIIIWTNSSHYMDDCFIPMVGAWDPRVSQLHQEMMSRAPRGSGSYESFQTI